VLQKHMQKSQFDLIQLWQRGDHFTRDEVKTPRMGRQMQRPSYPGHGASNQSSFPVQMKIL
jgi:hypothetical protein